MKGHNPNNRKPLALLEVPENPRVRFAPSPTGEMHVGGARTALYNWLVARKHQGTLLLRIEDTDLSRSDPSLTDKLKADLEWLGLGFDAEVSSQAARKEVHLEILNKLVEMGKAYRDPNTAEKIKLWKAENPGQGYRGEERGEGAYRFRVDHSGITEFTDLIKGSISFENRLLDDFVIARADGSPTFLLTNLADDLEMSDLVIRGDDHISNTPRQVIITQALGKQPLAYAHLPLLHGPNGKKLSKSAKNPDGSPMAVTLGELKSKGYIPEAVFSYLSKLGWGEAEDEILTKEELIKRFDIRRVNAAPARFDEQRLRHINGQLMRELNPVTYASYLGEFRGRTEADRLEKAVNIVQEKAQDLIQARELTEYLWKAPETYLEKDVTKWSRPDTIEVLASVQAALAECEWDSQSLEERLRSIIGERKPAEVFQPIRIALTGQAKSPYIGQTLWALEREEALERISRYADYLRAKSNPTL